MSKFNLLGQEARKNKQKKRGKKRKRKEREEERELNAIPVFPRPFYRNYAGPRIENFLDSETRTTSRTRFLNTGC